MPYKILKIFCAIIVSLLIMYFLISIYFIENKKIDGKLFGLHNKKFFCCFNSLIQIIYHTKLLTIIDESVHEKIIPLKEIFVHLKNNKKNAYDFCKEYEILYGNLYGANQIYVINRGGACFEGIFLKIFSYCNQSIHMIETYNYLRCSECNLIRYEPIQVLEEERCIYFNPKNIEKEFKNFTMNLKYCTTKSHKPSLDETITLYKINGIIPIMICDIYSQSKEFKVKIPKKGIVDRDGNEFFLKAFVEYIPGKIGHFRAYVKIENKWVLFSDMTYNIVDIDEILSFPRNILYVYYE